MTTKQTTAGNITKKTVRVPLVGNSQQRSTTLDKDQKFVNCIIETSTNSVTNTKKLFLVKRPGTSLHTSVATASEGRGVWYFAGSVYSVFGDTLYKDISSLQVLSTSTGICGAVEFVNNDDFGRPGLFIADGTDAWIVTYSGTISRVDNKHLQWQSSTLYEVGDRIVPTAIGTYWYTCTTSGRSGTSEPGTWNAGTTNDGTITWVRSGTYTGPAKYTVSTAYAVGDLRIPTTESGYWYKCTTAGTTNGTEPTDWVTTVGLTNTNNGVVFECAGEYGGFPTPHIPTPSFMDGFVVLPDANSHDIYNSTLSVPNSWNPLAFASAESFPDGLIGLARQNNYLVAFGENSTEFMYNSAKANDLPPSEYDSPFLSHETLILQVGSLNRNAILQSERTIMSIGRSALGGHGVWRIDGSTAKEISTEYIEKYIDLEDHTNNITGFGMRIAGHMFFVVNLPVANKTFVYDLEEQFWTEWNYNGGKLPFCYFADANGILLLQHESNGKIYQMNPELFQDFDQPISVNVTLAKQDFESDNYKFFTQTILIGDSTGHGVSLSWSDDDYATWSSPRVLSIGSRPYYTRTGAARRRAWRLQHTGNSRLRLEALEIVYTIGEH